jgi:DNA-binding SARP family transcriptional activator
MVELPHGMERVVAYLGINRVPISRPRLAAALWPDVADPRANGDLRSALWRLRRFARVLRDHNNRVGLDPEIAVDVAELVALSLSLVDLPTPSALKRLPDLVQGHEILPGWDEEWLVVERERFRLQRLRALERSAEYLLDQGAYGAALDAALACVASEPYRESAHRLVIRIHLAEGNNAEAYRAFGTYTGLVEEELGIAPSPLLADLVSPLVASR